MMIFQETFFPALRLDYLNNWGKKMLLLEQHAGKLFILKHFNARLNFVLSYTIFARRTLLLYCILIKLILQKLRL